MAEQCMTSTEGTTQERSVTTTEYTKHKEKQPVSFTLLSSIPCVQRVPWFKIGSMMKPQRDTAFIWVGSCNLNLDTLPKLGTISRSLGGGGRFARSEKSSEK
jgi:hypothetical protein